VRRRARLLGAAADRFGPEVWIKTVRSACVVLLETCVDEWQLAPLPLLATCNAIDVEMWAYCNDTLIEFEGMEIAIWRMKKM
jgi:hypothetical protein